MVVALFSIPEPKSPLPSALAVPSVASSSGAVEVFTFASAVDQLVQGKKTLADLVQATPFTAQQLCNLFWLKAAPQAQASCPKIQESFALISPEVPTEYGNKRSLYKSQIMQASDLIREFGDPKLMPTDFHAYAIVPEDRVIYLEVLAPGVKVKQSGKLAPATFALEQDPVHPEKLYAKIILAEDAFAGGTAQTATVLYAQLYFANLSLEGNLVAQFSKDANKVHREAGQAVIAFLERIQALISQGKSEAFKEDLQAAVGISVDSIDQALQQERDLLRKYAQ